MHRVNRCTLAGTVWAPTSANRAPAHCYPLPGRPPCRPPHPCLAPLPAPLGLRFRALLGLGFVPPPEPRPCAHCASIAYALLPAARVPLCRHRADPESSSRSLPSGSPVRIAPVAPTVRRHPRHPPHLSPRVAAAPGPWLARTAPYASLFRRMREKGPFPGNIRPKCMLFEIKMATSSPYASISGRNRAIQDAWRANLAAKGPFSRRGARNHAWREDVASAARPFSGSSLRFDRTGFVPCGSGMRHAAWPNGLCALRRGPGLLAACAPPCHLACARRGLRPLPSRPRSSPPSYTRRASPPASRPPRPAIRRAAHCGRGERRSGSFRRPRAVHADASRPPMRARRHRPSPNPRQPSPAHPWSRLRPSAPRHPPRLTLPRGSRCGSGNSREMVR